jgi:hypothetical protein
VLDPDFRMRRGKSGQCAVKWVWAVEPDVQEVISSTVQGSLPAVSTGFPGFQLAQPPAADSTASNTV